MILQAPAPPGKGAEKAKIKNARLCTIMYEYFEFHFFTLTFYTLEKGMER